MPEIKLKPLLKKIIDNYAFGEIRLLLLLFILLSAALIFLILSEFVTRGSTRHFDEFIIRALRDPQNISLPLGPKELPTVMRDITALGGTTFVVMLTTIVVIYLLLQKKVRSVLLVLLATLGGGLLEITLKNLINRPRPDIIFRLMQENSASFPSGHSMMATVMYLSIAVLLARLQKQASLRIYIVAVALTLTFLIGISRIYLGVHYPTDVLAGWCLGLSWATFIWFIAWFMELKAKVSSHRPGIQTRIPQITRPASER